MKQRFACSTWNELAHTADPHCFGRTRRPTCKHALGRALPLIMRGMAFVLLFSAGNGARAQADDLASATPPRKQVLADFLIEWMEARYPGAPSEGCVLYVSVKSQRMYYVRDKELEAEYVISTARNGLGEQANSNRTPQGLHRVVSKIGEGVPAFGIFESRNFTGAIARPDSTRDDLITSRILWLDGLEPGVNKGKGKDSMLRGIYIHGTADEATLGTPSSHGCIRMRNSDIIRLFDQVPLGTLVVILDN